MRLLTRVLDYKITFACNGISAASCIFLPTAAVSGVAQRLGRRSLVGGVTLPCTRSVVEQPSVQPTTVRPYPSAVPPGVKDVFVWLTETPAPSDFLFLVCYINVLTYLLLTGEHFVGKVSSMGRPTRQTQRSTPTGSANE